MKYLFFQRWKELVCFRSKPSFTLVYREKVKQNEDIHEHYMRQSGTQKHIREKVGSLRSWEFSMSMFFFFIMSIFLNVSTVFFFLLNVSYDVVYPA